VDIGGRQLYLTCRGTGSPTVILEAGLRTRSDIWSVPTDPAAVPPMVLPGISEFTRVCAYDRPGTLGEVNPDLDPYGPLFFPSRSDPVPQPRTTRDKVADLHALLRAADIPGPYVLVAHSAGGLVVRLYASEYPDEVVGIVLLDSTHEYVWLRFQEAMTPDQWAEFEALTVENQELLDAYPEASGICPTRTNHWSGTPGASGLRRCAHSFWPTASPPRRFRAGRAMRWKGHERCRTILPLVPDARRASHRERAQHSSGPRSWSSRAIGWSRRRGRMWLGADPPPVDRAARRSCSGHTEANVVGFMGNPCQPSTPDCSRCSARRAGGASC
jgi:pimeloyl-ACP methyl ester carboxylesterase